MGNSNKLLLVIHLNNSSHFWLAKSLKRIFGSLEYSGFCIDIMSFAELCDKEILQEVKNISGCRSVRIVDNSFYINKVKGEVLEDLNKRVSDIREQLLSLINSKIGSNWGKRFGELWWYTFLSEKNSHGAPFWWIFFYFEAACLRISEKSYINCVFLGLSGLDKLLQQFCLREQIDYRCKILKRSKETFIRLALMRLAGGFYASLVVAIACLRNGSTKNRVISKANMSKKVLMYSFYPRSWTYRFGQWQDMYWGETFNKLNSIPYIETIHALFTLDRNNFGFLINYIRSLRDLTNKNTQPKNYVFLESYTNPLYVLKEYLNLKDAVYYWYIVHSVEMERIFTWKGIKFYNISSYHMWKSVIVWWPAMLVLKRCAQNINLKLKPSLTLLPFFEYVEGKAIINGARLEKSGKIIGLQHGPITSMKMTYGGMPDELKQTSSGGVPLPLPDIFSVDGPLSKEILSQRGICKERIEEIGPARFDDVWKMAKLSSKRSRFKDDRVVLLLAPTYRDTEFMIKFVLNALLDDSRLKIIIKLHPKSNSFNLDKMLHYYSDFNKRPCAKVEISREREIYKCMEQTDIMLTTYSSTGVEAIAFGLPVIVIILKNIPNMSPLSYDGSPVLTASNPEFLRKHVDLLVEDKGFYENYQNQLKKVLFKNYGKIDSHASDRFAKLCIKQIQD